MATEVTCIVDTDGTQDPHYTSLSAAIAGETGASPVAVTDDDLDTNDEQLTIECRATTGTADTYADVTGFTTSSTCFVKIIAHEDHRHAGAWDTDKYRLVATRNGNTVVSASDDHVQVWYLQIENTGTTGTRSCIKIHGGAGTEYKCVGNFIRSNNAVTSGIYDELRCDLLHYENNIVHGDFARCFDRTLMNAGGVIKCFGNIAAYGTDYGLKLYRSYPSGTVTAYISNNIGIGNTNYDMRFYGGGTLTEDSNTNMSEDTSAFGTGAITEVTPADIFTDPTNGDFTLLSTSDAVDAGTDVSGDGALSVDIAGTSRGATWDIGAFEYVSAATAYTLDAASGTYSLTGTAASLLISRLISAAAGSITLSGQDASLLHGRLVSAGAGEMTLTGQAASLLHDRLVVAGAGSITLTGTDADLLRAAVLSAGLGEYALTGTDAALLRGFALTASGDAYILTGQDAGLVRGFALTASGDAYILTGQDASLLRGMVLSAGAGTVEITGMDVTLTYVEGLGLTAESGTFTLTGSDASLLVGRKLSAESGTITLDGQAASLLFGRLISSGVGSVTITGADASLLRGLNLSAEAGSMDLTGQDVTLTWSGLTLPSGAVSITFTVAKPAVTFSASKPSVTFAATKPSITFSTN